MNLKNQNLYPLTYVFNGYHIEIKSDLQPGNIGLDKNTVFINRQPLAVWQEGSAYRCIVTPYKIFPTLEETANAGVIALDGKELSPLQEDRLGRLPEGLPDLDNPGLPRVRKNILNMTQGERNLFIQAILSLKNNTKHPFSGAYDTMIKVHMDTFLPEGHMWSAHQNILLPWHRIFIYHFESLLRAQPGFENVTVPYWDWTQVAERGTLPFTDDFMGTTGKENDDTGTQEVLDGPFAYSKGNWNIVPDNNWNPITWLTRSKNKALFGQPIIEPAILSGILDIENFAIRGTPGEGFGYNLNTKMHNEVHDDVGGAMSSHASPNDPIFWLHHCMLDKVWADWQERYPNSTYVNEPDYHPEFDPDNDYIQPWLEDLNRKITINDMFNYKRLFRYE